MSGKRLLLLERFGIFGRYPNRMGRAMDHHEKLAWSAQHLHALDLEIKDFVERHPFTARGHHRHGTREFGVIVDRMPLLPGHWPVMVGDAIQNMRTALDHLIWAL